jgi:hypothetical protein
MSFANGRHGKTHRYARSSKTQNTISSTPSMTLPIKQRLIYLNKTFSNGALLGHLVGSRVKLFYAPRGHFLYALYLL